MCSVSFTLPTPAHVCAFHELGTEKGPSHQAEMEAGLTEGAPDAGERGPEAGEGTGRDRTKIAANQELL